jgi:Protein of unknown function (DUF1559)
VFMTDYVGITGTDVGTLIQGFTGSSICFVGGSSSNWPPPPNSQGIFNNTFSPTTWAGNAVSIAQITDGTSSTLMIGERPFITPGVGGSYQASNTGPNWPAFLNYYNCPPNNNMAMGYYIYSGQLSRDTVTGVNNTTTIISNNNDPNYTACSSGPYYYGKGPNNVNNACSFNYIWSNHIGGSLFCMGDGSVRMVSYSVSTATLNSASTYAGGEVLGSDW